MDNEQRAALRKLAEEATPGPWWSGECRPPDGHSLAWLGQSFVDCDGGRKNYVASSRDADYIAAANPETILQLLDYIETLEKDAARLNWIYQQDFNDRQYDGSFDDFVAQRNARIAASMQGETE